MEKASATANGRALILLVDGTSNDYSGLTNIRILQNIFNEYSSEIALNEKVSDVIVKYFTGLATSSDILRDSKDALFASGLKRKIIDAYMFLVENYKPNDKVYLFGFSRGAYIVRCLAGLLRKDAILQLSKHDNPVQHANNVLEDHIKFNRSFLETSGNRLSNLATTSKIPSRSFNSIFIVEKIEFIGLFDTVMGYCHDTPSEKCYDTFYSDNFIRSSLHLIAKSQNTLFSSISFHSDVNGGLHQCVDRLENDCCEMRVEAGDHCDVGGGWEKEPKHKVALSNGYLKLMLQFRFCYLLRHLKDVYPYPYLENSQYYTHSIENPDHMRDFPFKWLTYRTMLAFSKFLSQLPSRFPSKVFVESSPFSFQSYCFCCANNVCLNQSYLNQRQSTSKEVQSLQSSFHSSADALLTQPSLTSLNNTPNTVEISSEKCERIRKTHKHLNSGDVSKEVVDDEDKIIQWRSESLSSNYDDKATLFEKEKSSIQKLSGSQISSKALSTSAIYGCQSTTNRVSSSCKTVTIGCLLREKNSQGMLYFVTPHHGHGDDCACRGLRFANSDIYLVELAEGLNCFNYVEAVFTRSYKNSEHSILISGYFTSICNYDRVQTYIAENKISSDTPFYFVFSSVVQEWLPAGSEVSLYNGNLEFPFTRLSEGDSGSVLFIKRTDNDKLEVLGILQGWNPETNKFSFIAMSALSSDYDVVRGATMEEVEEESQTYKYYLNETEFKNIFRPFLNDHNRSFLNINNYRINKHNLLYEIELYQYCQVDTTTENGESTIETFLEKYIGNIKDTLSLQNLKVGITKSLDETFITEKFGGTINLLCPEDIQHFDAVISSHSIRQVILVRKTSNYDSNLPNILARLSSIDEKRKQLPAKLKASILICDRVLDLVVPLKHIYSKETKEPIINNGTLQSYLMELSSLLNQVEKHLQSLYSEDHLHQSHSFIRCILHLSTLAEFEESSLQVIDNIMRIICPSIVSRSSIFRDAFKRENFFIVGEMIMNLNLLKKDAQEIYSLVEERRLPDPILQFLKTVTSRFRLRTIQELQKLSDPLSAFQIPCRAIIIFISGNKSSILSLHSMMKSYSEQIREAEHVSHVIVKYFPYQPHISSEDNIAKMYLYLTEQYLPGDKIYIFGEYSGAFIAQWLVGFIAAVNILAFRDNFDPSEKHDLIRRAVINCNLVKRAIWIGLSWVQVRALFRHIPEQIIRDTAEVLNFYIVDSIEYLGLLNLVLPEGESYQISLYCDRTIPNRTELKKKEEEIKSSRFLQRFCHMIVRDNGGFPQSSIFPLPEINNLSEGYHKSHFDEDYCEFSVTLNENLDIATKDVEKVLFHCFPYLSAPRFKGINFQFTAWILIALAAASFLLHLSDLILVLLNAAH